MSNMEEQLRKELAELKESNLKGSGAQGASQKSHISKESIMEFVNTLLNDENVNVKFFPDVVERQLYRNVINIIMEILKHTVESCCIKVMGHEITIALRPSDPKAIPKENPKADQTGL